MSVLDWILIGIGVVAVVVFATVEIIKFKNERKGHKPTPKKDEDEKDVITYEIDD